MDKVAKSRENHSKIRKIEAEAKQKNRGEQRDSYRDYSEIDR